MIETYNKDGSEAWDRCKNSSFTRLADENTIEDEIA